MINRQETCPRASDPRPPLTWYAANDIAALSFEEIDHIQAGSCGEVMIGVGEAKAPDTDNGFSVLCRICRRGRVGAHFTGPVGLDLRLHIRPARNVIHDIELAAERLCGGAHFCRNSVADGSLRTVRVETLQGGAVKAVLLHPQELRVDGRLIPV